jgi:hypothetical protein
MGVKWRFQPPKWAEKQLRPVGRQDKLKVSRICGPVPSVIRVLFAVTVEGGKNLEIPLTSKDLSITVGGAMEEYRIQVENEACCLFHVAKISDSGHVGRTVVRHRCVCDLKSNSCLSATRRSHFQTQAILK